MKSTKLLAALFLLFVTSAIFAQKVHYKDSYYTIVKSKIFHRGYDVYGQLSPGKIDTIHIIAKELYNEKGKLKDKYKKRKKRERYDLPEKFWEQRELAAAEAANKNKPTPTAAQISQTENRAEVSTETAVKETTPSVKEEEVVAQNKPVSKIIEEKATEKVQKEEATQTKKVASVTEDKKVEKEEKPSNENDKKRATEEKIQQQKQDKKEVVVANRKKEETQQKKEEREEKNEEKRKETQEKSARKADKKTAIEEKAQQQKEEKTAKIAERNNEKEKAIEKTQNKKSKDAKNKAEKSIAKEKYDSKKSADKIEKKQRTLEKENKEKLKNQKALKAKEAALASASIVSTSIADEDTFGTIYIKVNKEKTNTTKTGGILLFFDVINNSNKDLVILKPNNSIDNRLDFFSNTMECENVPVSSTDYLPKELKIKDEDYITIPAKAKIELFINGNYRYWLACNSEDIVLQLLYNPFKSAEEGTELAPTLKKQLSKSLKKITPIKIESENIKFKLNKQE